MPEVTDPGSEDATSRFAIDLTGATLLGLYRVERRLAEGGMGAIYLAEDTNLGRPVVVKVPHPRFLGDAEFRERLAREIEELVRLEHPHIVRILARGEHRELPFFVLQYLGGGSLEDRLVAAGGRLAPAETLPWLETMARTLDHVHERGIVHRDVKPANVLFDETGHVFLSDFGVAKTLQAKGAELTQTGVSIGSPRYMAPEQGMGKNTGPAADQYALASTVYEALAGRPPFEGEQVVEILVRKMREEPPPISELVPELPADTAGAVMRALSRDPAARFASCREFFEACAAGLRADGSDPSRSGASAAPPDPAPPARTTVRARGPWRLALGGLAVVALVAVLYGLLSHRDPPPEGQEAPPASAAGEGEPSPSDVSLTHPGQEPRQALRYFVAPGAREWLVFTVTSNTEYEVDGEVKSTPQFPVEMDSVVLVREVEDDGSFVFGWEVVGCDVTESARHEAPMTTRRALAQAVGTAALAVTDDRGRLQSVEFEDPARRGVLFQPVRTGLGAGLELLVVPLPEEEVGVGASWENSRTVDHQGVRLTRTTTYEVLAIEGHQVRIRHSHLFAAPPQRASPPGTAQGVAVRVKKLVMSGEGETVVDLSRAVPLHASYDLEVQLRAENSKAGRTWEETLEQTVHMELRRK